MIITCYGTSHAKNCAPQVMAACAFETAYDLSRKTLVLQFYQRYPVETLLLGQVQGEKQTGLSDDTGMDSLLRLVRADSLKEDHFTTYTRQILSTKNSTHDFDVATVPKLADFRTEIIEEKEVVKELLETAAGIYDTIFVLADGKDKEMIEMLSKLSDTKLVCIPQDVKQTIHCEDDKTYYVVADYDEESVFHAKYLRKAYKTKKLYTLPHNTSFNDAYKKNSVLKFLYQNNHKKDSSTGEFIKSLKELNYILAGNKAKEEEEVNFDFKALEQKEKAAVEKDVIKTESVDITIKKRRFRKEKVTVSLNADTKTKETKKSKKKVKRGK